MKFSNGLQIAAGIIAAFVFLAWAAGIGVGRAVMIPFAALMVGGFAVLVQRKKSPWPFLKGLLAGFCIAIIITLSLLALLASACWSMSSRGL